MNSDVGARSVASTELDGGVLDHLAAHRRGDLTQAELGRINATLGVVPPGITSALDVGCGDARVSRRLAGASCRVVGVDYSRFSLRAPDFPAVCASSAKLPFRDASFDLVMCCEVLEHLPSSTLERTVEELKRVSRRYVLVSVPNKEKLAVLQTKCSRCGTVFHIWGHVHSFSSRKVNKLFGHDRPASTHYCGESPPFRFGFIQKVNQRLGNRWAEFDDVTMCPTCGNTQFARTRRNIVTILCGAINLLCATLVPLFRKNWLIKLYDLRSDR